MILLKILHNILTETLTNNDFVFSNKIISNNAGIGYDYCSLNIKKLNKANIIIKMPNDGNNIKRYYLNPKFRKRLKEYIMLLEDILKVL